MSDIEAETVVAELVDDSVVAPVGEPCEWCGAPIEVGDKFCPGCGQSISLPAAATAMPEPLPAVVEAAPVAGLLRAVLVHCDHYIGCGWSSVAIVDADRVVTIVKP